MAKCSGASQAATRWRSTGRRRSRPSFTTPGTQRLYHGSVKHPLHAPPPYTESMLGHGAWLGHATIWGMERVGAIYMEHASHWACTGAWSMSHISHVGGVGGGHGACMPHDYEPGVCWGMGHDGACWCWGMSFGTSTLGHAPRHPESNPRGVLCFLSK